tara:strand:+ start:469 stop:834 length:366 start_codon:yes stop_codon:yes gene_type:complete
LAHFAQTENNIVTKVIVVDNKDTSNEKGVEIEQIGIDFCSNLLGGTWKQTSYNGTIRKNYAGIGFTYDEGRDAFIAPKPFNSWLLDEDTCQWKAPVPMPTDDKRYTWDEATLAWVALENTL